MKLFNSKKDDKEIAVADTGYRETIQMIHNEFLSAGERLYQEALTIINTAKVPNQAKAERLSAMGFFSSLETTAAQEVVAKKLQSKHMAAIIKYYRDKYPLYKFIREEDVTTICEKYGLISGDVTNYTGFVPDKNLREIESFKIEDRDRRVRKIYNGPRDADTFLSMEETHRYWERREADELEAAARMAEGGIAMRFHQDSMISHRVDSAFRIAAPLKDFKLNPWDEIKGTKIVLKAIPDPVVLCPVAEGYLIVTAWGDEASDPIVQNELNN